MQLRYAYRLTPTPAQRQALGRAFGCARVVFNDAIAARRDAREAGAPFPIDAQLSKALTAAKRTPQRAWLGEVSAVVLQQALADANTAYRNFFASITGTRKGRKLGAPRFRSRKDRAQSIRFTKAARFRVLPNGRLRLPGSGDVPVRWSRKLPSEPSSVTVTVDAAGRYHCSFVVESPDTPLPPASREVGIDLGLTHFAVLSDGCKVDAPRFARKAQAKLARAQRELARRQKGSANREKSRRTVARAHVRVADTRRDWLHKLSTTVVRENQLIAVEDLAVSGLARTRLARSVHDAGWSTFVGMLMYKARRAGRMLVKVDRWSRRGGRQGADVTGDVAVVTGAGSGIGRAVGRALLDAGWRVALAGRRATPLEETAGGADAALVVPTDVSDPESVADLFASARGEWGRVDLLVNNAGTFGPVGEVDDIPVEAWLSTVAVNLTGAFLCARAAVATMKAQHPQGGRIINNGSISAHTPRPGTAAYTATKHALTGLTKSLSLDGRPHGIACGQIDIGNAATEMTAGIAAGARQADGRVVPEPTFDVRHVAEAVLFMAGLPLDANVQFMTVTATTMPFIGRG